MMILKKTVLVVGGVISVAAAFAQLPVERESHHRVVVENQYVRVLELVLPAGDTTPMHRHSAASVVVFLSPSKLVIQNEGEKSVTADVLPGNTVYRGYDEKPLIHKVWTADRLPFRCLVVEIKKNTALKTECAGLPAEATLNFDNQRAKVVTLELAKGKEYSVGEKGCRYFLIDVSGAIIANFQKGTKSMVENGFDFISAAGRIRAVAEDTKVILIELK
jgi:hypothetical protein